MHVLLILASLLLVVSGDSPKHLIFKKLPPGATRPDNAVGATYQAITKRHSGTITAEILNTVTSPHSSASVSFTTTSADHNPSQHHPVYAKLAPDHPAYVKPAPEQPVYSKPTPTPYTPIAYVKSTPYPIKLIEPAPSAYPIEYAKPYPYPVEHAKPTPYPVKYVVPAPTPYPVEYTKPAPTPYITGYPPASHPYTEYSGLYAKPVKPSQYYDLQNIIVNDQEHVVPEYPVQSYFNYRFAPNQTAIQYPPPLAQASPKAFGYQPVITLANNMKTFYKINQYAPFVVPPNQYYTDYANNYLTNSYGPTEPPYSSYPESPAKLVFPSPVVSYNVSAYNTPGPVLPHAPLPPPEAYTLGPVQPKPYKNNAYLEPEPPQYGPVILLNKYAP